MGFLGKFSGPSFTKKIQNFLVRGGGTLVGDQILRDRAGNIITRILELYEKVAIKAHAIQTMLQVQQFAMQQSCMLYKAETIM